MDLIQGLIVTVVGGLILWGLTRWIVHWLDHARGESREPEQLALAVDPELRDSDGDPEAHEDLDDVEIEILRILAEIHPDECLEEAAISRRLNRRIDSHLSRQLLRFHLERLEGEELIEPEGGYVLSPSEYAAEACYQLTTAGRDLAVELGLLE